ncbi:unnamed protein product [Didymodactylos carnosus]|uniref:Hepatocellular carcinoma-associated antigen 59 n=1 Tax=Didymodactylos carnosus TaxID=1234261 RepID=A0A813V2N4_9BILA|nr:unnamed protein product [Didymodactylos carnosus]CAF0835806.1 unnamed protein product [Didymodactylos carnosus]CAF3507311.1 unnamed protein product [Didymodactylos carnosus]CAF3623018.1 unnamed protein product [Didymodactylos carnosus]
MSHRSHIRHRHNSEENDNSDEEEQVVEKKEDGAIQDLKLMQKLRQRKKGLTIDELALGKPLVNGKDDHDPFNLKTGGLIDLKKAKSKDVNNINNNFARETNTRDEDTEMQRYIEEQLAKLHGKNENDESTPNHINERNFKIKKPEDTLFHVSQHLIVNHSQHTSEEMLSEQMLSGIPEVEVGVDEKIRNIEETDRAKRKLLQSLRDKKVEKMTAMIQPAPKSTAVNFVQHKRFNTDMMEILPKRYKQNKDIVRPQLVVGNKEKHPAILRDPKPPGNPSDKPISETATDDLVFDHFRKNLHNNRNWKIRLA